MPHVQQTYVDNVHTLPRQRSRIEEERAVYPMR
jgi:hypothetical protein